MKKLPEVLKKKFPNATKQAYCQQGKIDLPAVDEGKIRLSEKDMEQIIDQALAKCKSQNNPPDDITEKLLQQGIDVVSIYLDRMLDEREYNTH